MRFQGPADSCSVLLGNGLFGTLTALRMSEEGLDPTIIGVVVSCHSIGFIVGCLYGQRIGHIRCFTAFAAVLAVVCLILPMPVNPYSWILLHLVFGFCSAMLLMVSHAPSGMAVLPLGRMPKMRSSHRHALTKNNESTSEFVKFAIFSKSFHNFTIFLDIYQENPAFSEF